MSRDAILSRIRRSLGQAGSKTDPDRLARVEQRLAERPRVAPPGRVSSGDLVGVFRHELERQLATVKEIADAAHIPAAIAAFLRAHNQPLALAHGGDEAFFALDFAAAGVAARTGPALPADSTGLSAAMAGIAETGTMVLKSGPDNPVTLSFLPETHVIVVPKSRIVATYEDAFQLLRDLDGAGVMPRTLNMISGPSRTADIGGRIVIGAHGPRRLLALIDAGS